MNWINETFGTEFSTEIQLGIMFVALLVALLIIIWLFRKIFGAAGSRVARSRQPRLGVVEAAIVDDTRRLVLVRRDNVEHLLMIGGPGDVVVENNIQRTPPAQPVPAQTHQAPETTPREPRLIEPVSEKVPAVTETLPPRREIISETPAVAATGAAIAAGVAANETAEAADTPDANASIEPSGTDSAVEELAQELTGNLDMVADELDSTAEALVTPEAPEGDTGTDTEEDMQKLLDELAGEKS